MRHVFHTMGTVVSIEAPRAPVPERIRDQVEEAFRRADRTFSMYRADSEMSRLAAGTLMLSAASTTVRSAYEQAMEWRTRTDGAFDPYRPDGVVDLSGIVKAVAIDAAGSCLDAWGGSEWLIDAGGDILTSAGGA